MKNAAKSALIAGGALLLAMLALGNWGVNGNVKVLKANKTPILTWADGGVPIPPPPKRVRFLDGGVPIPPPPKKTALSTANALLLADGGVPIPPPPKGTGFSTTAASPKLLADGGVPIPPPPTGKSSAMWSSNLHAV